MRRMLFAGAGLGALLGLGTAAAAQDRGPPPGGGTRGGMDRMLEQRFAEMDTDHDGAVTRAEYDAYRAKMRAEREARRNGRHDRGGDAPPPPPPGAMPPPGATPPLGYDPAGGGAPPPPPGGGMGPPPGSGMGPPPGGPRGAMGGRPGGQGPMGDAWFDRADANHDGKVTLAEAKAAMRAMMDGRRGMRGPGGDMPPPPQ